MSPAEVWDWLTKRSATLTARGLRTCLIQRESSNDPDLALSIESETALASISVWTGLDAAELHALRVEDGHDLLREHVRLKDQSLGLALRPLLTFFDRLA